MTWRHFCFCASRKKRLLSGLLAPAEQEGAVEIYNPQCQREAWPERDDRDPVDGSSPHPQGCGEAKPEHGCQQHDVRQRHPSDPGAGDGKQLCVSSAWVGWMALPDVVLLAAMFGLDRKST